MSSLRFPSLGMGMGIGIGIAELVERPTLFSCRYKIPHQDGMNLADVFGHFEAAKAKVGCGVFSTTCSRPKASKDSTY